MQFTQVAADDLDIARIGQLAATHPALGDLLEARSVQVIALNAPFGRRGYLTVGAETRAG
jgi:hypothetical protein